jgi:hypothetical protein
MNRPAYSVADDRPSPLVYITPALLTAGVVWLWALLSRLPLH